MQLEDEMLVVLVKSLAGGAQCRVGAAFISPRATKWDSPHVQEQAKIKNDDRVAEVCQREVRFFQIFFVVVFVSLLLSLYFFCSASSSLSLLPSLIFEQRLFCHQQECSLFVFFLFFLFLFLLSLFLLSLFLFLFCFLLHF